MRSGFLGRGRGRAVQLATIEATLAALPAESREALGGAAIFRGGFGLTAFADVVLGGDTFAAMELLQSFHDRSLLSVRGVTGTEERRFFLDESVRERVGRQAIGPVHLAHAEWFVAKARAHASERAWVERERENLLRARETLLALETPTGIEHALTLICVLEPVFQATGSASTYVELWDATYRPNLGNEIEADARLARGRAEHALGEHDAARVEFDRVIELAEEAGRDELALLALLEAGQSARLAGDFSEAESRLTRARAILDRSRAVRLEQRYRTELASLWSDEGRLDDALELEQANLAEVLTARERAPREEAEARMRVAAHARRQGRTEQADEHTQRAHELLGELGESVPEASDVPSVPSELLVSRNADRVELVPGPRIDLARRPTLRRLVVALVRARRERPGQGLTVQALFDAGWPGARIRAESQAARVYVAINSLKKLGFDRVLTRQDDGYLLVPELAVTELT